MRPVCSRFPRGSASSRSLRTCASLRTACTLPRRATVRRRFIDRCNLTKLPDSICNLTISSLCVRPPGWRRNPIRAARAHCRDVSKNALKELPECVCNMGNLTSLYAPPEAWMTLVAAPSIVAAGTRSTTSCKRCRASKAAGRAARIRCFTCASLRCALLLLLIGAATEQKLRFAAGSSATTASKICADFRAPCSGCARSAVSEPCRARVRVPRARGGSALGLLDLAHVQRGVEQRHHRIPPYRRRKPRARGAASPVRPTLPRAAAVASGSGSLRSDLRDNKLKMLPVENILAEALQLETLYAAANACALRAHRTIGFMARRLAGGNALYCGTDTPNCFFDETLTIRSRATEMYASVAAGGIWIGRYRYIHTSMRECVNMYVCTYVSMCI
jgi:hypothetical protein